jgi:hypothetical protein
MLAAMATRGRMKRYSVAVRALCEFTAKQGDLDLRFTPTPTAQEGIQGHAIVAARRGENYRSEFALEGEFGPLRVRGRADGYDPDRKLIEEVKTYRGQLSSIPANHRHLHWAQLRVYGHLLCQQLGLETVNLALVYFDIGSQQETAFNETRTRAELAALFEDQCTRFTAWAEQELAHRTRRDAALDAMRFPHADFRPGQRQLAEAVFRANAGKRSLLAQAPTGIGKTVGTLFPALKAAPKQELDKLFFLAAKTPGRQLALDAAATLKSGASLPLRVLELAARDKACEHPDKACRGDSCPLAQGFYDRLPAARAAALDAPVLDRATLRGIGLEHQVCPYYLGSEMTRWSDVVVGDYNYWFDGGAMLYNLAQANAWRVSVLADEAHNLVSRARSMYSAGLERASLRAARAVAPAPVEKTPGKAGPRLDRRRQGCAPALPGAGQAAAKIRRCAHRRRQRHHRAPGRQRRAARPGPAGILFRRPAVRAPGRILRRTLAVRPDARRRARHRPVHPQRGAGALPRSRASPTPIRPRCSRPRSVPGIISPTCSACPRIRPGSTSSRRSRPASSPSAWPTASRPATSSVPPRWRRSPR